MTIDGLRFRHIAVIEPMRSPDGAVAEYSPHAQFLNSRGLRLNRHGTGPFCKFRLPGALHSSGVYAITIDSTIVYIGECVSLATRFGSRGYGLISPRNCFEGGQSTNCKINNLILKAIKDGSEVALWFHESSDYKAIEGRIRTLLRPAWNSV